MIKVYVIDKENYIRQSPINLDVIRPAYIYDAVKELPNDAVVETINPYVVQAIRKHTGMREDEDYAKFYWVKEDTVEDITTNISVMFDKLFCKPLKDLMQS